MSVQFADKVRDLHSTSDHNHVDNNSDTLPSNPALPPHDLKHILNNGREEQINAVYALHKRDGYNGVVYAESDELMKTVDDLCYPGTMIDPASPLTLIGKVFFFSLDFLSDLLHSLDSKHPTPSLTIPSTLNRYCRSLRLGQDRSDFELDQEEKGHDG